MTRAAGRDAPVFLVGFMGVGKTTVGHALATRLGWAFADTDAMVEQSAGRSIEEIFRESGEGRFREVEWDALRSLQGRKHLVVATGGGTFVEAWLLAQEVTRIRREMAVWRRIGFPRSVENCEDLH